MIRPATLSLLLVALLSSSATLLATPNRFRLSDGTLPLNPYMGSLGSAAAFLSDSARVDFFDLSTPTRPRRASSFHLGSIVGLAGNAQQSWLLQELDCAYYNTSVSAYLPLELQLEGASAIQARSDTAWVVDKKGLHCITTSSHILVSHENLDGLCVGENQVWTTDGDSLYHITGATLLSFGKEQVPQHLLCDTGDQLLASDSTGTFWRLYYHDPHPTWCQDSLGSPLLQAKHWRDGLIWSVDASGSLCCLDTETSPPRVLRRSESLGATQFAINGDTLLASGNGHCRLMRASMNAGGGVELQTLGQLAAPAVPLAILSAPFGDHDACWLLDQSLGWRVLLPDAEWSETLRAPQPTPVRGGDLRNGVLATCSEGNGLRYYELDGDSLILRGLHFNDELALVSLGPGGLIGYVTPTGYVAIKGIQRSPWDLLHFGHLPTGHTPSAVCWQDSLLLIGSPDAMLSVVDARDVLHPVCHPITVAADSILQLVVHGDSLLLVTPTEARLLHHDSDVEFSELASWSASNARWSAGCISSGVVLAQQNPHRACWYPSGTSDTTPLWVRLPRSPLLACATQQGDILIADAQGGVSQLELSTVEAIDSTSLHCFPNPADAAINVQVAVTLAGNLELCITDLLGRRILRRSVFINEPGFHEFQFAASSLASGIYLLSRKGCGTDECVQFLVQH